MINSDQLVGLQLSNTSKQFKNTIKYLKLCHLLIRTTVWMTRPTFTVRYLLLLLLNMLLLILKKVDGQATLGTMIELKVDLLCLCILESWFVLCYGCVWASNSQQNLKASFWGGLGVKKLQFLTLALLNDDEETSVFFIFDVLFSLSPFQTSGTGISGWHGAKLGSFSSHGHQACSIFGM